MINYNVENPMNAFMGAAGGLQQLQSNQMAIDNAIAEKQAQQQAAQNQADLMSKFGQLDFSNQDQLQQFVQQNPQMLEQVKSVLGFGDDARNKQALDAATQFNRALNSGNPDLIENTISSIAPIIDNNGDPTFTSNTARQMAQTTQGIQQLKLMSQGYIAELGGKDYLAQTALTPQQQQQNQFKRQELGLQRDKFNFDKEIKRADLDLKRAKAQGDPAKIAKAEQEKTEAQFQDQQKIENGIYTATQNKNVIDDLLANDSYMNSVTGYSGRAPTVTTTGVEAEAYLDNIKNSMTIDNLGVMSGPLTDKDIQIIASASSRLRPGMSKPQMEKELKTIKSSYDRVIRNYEKEANRKGYEMTQENVTLSDEDLVSKYL